MLLAAGIVWAHVLQHCLERQGVDDVALVAGHRLGGGQGIEDRLFHCFDRGMKERVHLGMGEHTQGERFAGVGEVWFVPWDGKATDAAMLTARPVAHSSPRSALTGAVRRFVGEAVEPPVATTRRERGRERVTGRIPRTA